MSKKSFRTIDGAVWGAVNILLGALKSVPQEWAGLKEIGMGGKNYIPLQGKGRHECHILWMLSFEALALEAEKILVYNLFRNRGSRDRKQMKLGIRFVEVRPATGRSVRNLLTKADTTWPAVPVEFSTSSIIPRRGIRCNFSASGSLIWWLLGLTESLIL